MSSISRKPLILSRFIIFQITTWHQPGNVHGFYLFLVARSILSACLSVAYIFITDYIGITNDEFVLFTTWVLPYLAVWSHVRPIVVVTRR